MVQKCPTRTVPLGQKRRKKMKQLEKLRNVLKEELKKIVKEDYFEDIAKEWLESKKKKIKKLLLIATGALMNSTSSQQGESIPGIAHAVSIEL
mgnify:CR=1 FL=1